MVTGAGTEVTGAGTEQQAARINRQPVRAETSLSGQFGSAVYFSPSPALGAIMVAIFDFGALVSGAGVGGVPLSAAVGSELPHPVTEESTNSNAQLMKRRDIMSTLFLETCGNKTADMQFGARQPFKELPRLV